MTDPTSRTTTGTETFRTCRQRFVTADTYCGGVVPELFAKRCPGCRAARGPLCRTCTQRFTAGPNTALGFDAGRVTGTALVRYDEFSQQVVLAAKNRGRTDVLDDLGVLLARLGPVIRSPCAGRTVVSWIPASRSGRRTRGYDQGRLLARSVARELRRRNGRRSVAVQVRPVLHRRGSRVQTGRTRSQRLRGPDLVWIAPADLDHVILVDDVVTTGSSIQTATTLAAAAGVSRIEALAVAVVT